MKKLSSIEWKNTVRFNEKMLFNWMKKLQFYLMKKYNSI